MSATVLVVEDDEMVAEVVRVGLAADGLTVVHAATAEAGVAAAGQQRPDLVLLDVSKVETAGWDALARMRDESGLTDVPIIVMSPRTLPADQERGYGLGVTAYLTKPFTVEELLSRVHDALPPRPDQGAKSGPTST